MKRFLKGLVVAVGLSVYGWLMMGIGAGIMQFAAEKAIDKFLEDYDIRELMKICRPKTKKD